MQILNLPGTAAGTQPTYLPLDKAPVPFGDPLAATMTAATPSVITVPGYAPTQNDIVSFSVGGAASSLFATSSFAGSLTSQFALNNAYYVTPAGGASFTLSTQKSSVAITSVSAWNTASANAGGTLFVHTLSNQTDGTTIPFKPNNQALAINLGYYTSSGSPASITLFGASDLSATLATASYGTVIGPGTYSVIATIAPYTAALVTLSKDWVVASASTASLILIQN
jgi:hypothetical protein